MMRMRIARVYHISPDLDQGEGWELIEAGTKRALGWYLSLQVGVATACELAKEDRPSRVIVHDRNGRVTNTYSY